MLLDMGYTGHTAKAEALKMIEHADKNNDGMVDFDEFKQVWYRKVLSTNDQYIHRVFSVFDDNGDGHIDASELQQILFPKTGRGRYKESDSDGPTHRSFGALIAIRRSVGGRGRRIAAGRGQIGESPR